MAKFDYKAALDAGYSEDEITDYLSSSRPNFDVKGAKDAGYSLEEISQHLNEPSEVAQEAAPEKSNLEKGARIAGQYVLGALEGSPAGMAYDIGISPISSKSFYTFLDLQRMGEDIEYLAEKNFGKAVKDWPEQDRALYEDISEKIKNPQKVYEETKAGPDLSLRGIAEKVTGQDLTPEGTVEKAVQWAGFIKDFRKIFELKKTGVTAKGLAKALAPTGTEVLRGTAAGAALQLAEEGNYGPIGVLASALIGDISGNFAAGALKNAVKIIKNPKEILAEVAAKFTKKDKLELQKEIIEDFRKSGVQADIGTITDSDLVKFMQSRLAQSGLTGKALDELKETITQQVKDEYKTLAESVGEARLNTAHEAGEATKSYVKNIRDTEIKEIGNLYKEAKDSIKKDAFVDSEGLFKKIDAIENELKPGSLKSSEQNSVLEVLKKLRRDISDSEGNRLFANVKDLMNNKIALNDVINYEIQGGAKQLLKGVVSEIDRAIISYGKENPAFVKNYIKANQSFSKHAKEFRNKRVSNLLNESDPTSVINKMNTVQGIRDLEQILKKNPEGSKLMEDLKRFKLDRMISDNMIDSTTQQIKFGTFSKLAEKAKTKEILKEILPKQSYSRLQRLMKNSGKLAESAQKFLNSSKSGVTIEDAGVVSKVLWDLSNLLAGNPWPLIKTGAGIGSSRYLTKLMGDPEFLKLVEEMILATEKNNTSSMSKIASQLVPIVRTAMQEEKKEK